MSAHDTCDYCRHKRSEHRVDYCDGTFGEYAVCSCERFSCERFVEAAQPRKEVRDMGDLWTFLDKAVNAGRITLTPDEAEWLHCDQPRPAPSYSEKEMRQVSDELSAAVAERNEMVQRWKGHLGAYQRLQRQFEVLKKERSEISNAYEFMQRKRDEWKDKATRVCDQLDCNAAVVRRDDGSRVCGAGHKSRWVERGDHDVLRARSEKAEAEYIRALRDGQAWALARAEGAEKQLAKVIAAIMEQRGNHGHDGTRSGCLSCTLIREGVIEPPPPPEPSVSVVKLRDALMGCNADACRAIVRLCNKAGR